MATDTLPAQTEAQFMAAVRHYARLMGWRTYHTLRSKGSEPGYPDLCMVRGDRVMFAELKTEKGRVSPAQLDWLDDLKQSGRVEVYVWRPSNWRHIEEVLAR